MNGLDFADFKKCDTKRSNVVRQIDCPLIYLLFICFVIFQKKKEKRKMMTKTKFVLLKCFNNFNQACHQQCRNNFSFYFAEIK